MVKTDMRTPPVHFALALLALLQLHLHLHPASVTFGSFVIPGLPKKKFLEVNDINIGLLLPLSSYNTEAAACDDDGWSFLAVHLTQLVEYRIHALNEGSHLPSNVTLGFVALNECYDINMAAAQALTFLPQTGCKGPYSSVAGDVVDTYDVVAVIGPTTSSQSKAVSHVLGPAQVPLVSFFSTSDELSDKTLFPYFLRTVPPDRFQFHAIFTIIQQLGWTYVSVVYGEGSYGENGFRQLRDLMEKHGHCLGAALKVSKNFSVDQADMVAQSLLTHRNARAVILITDSASAHGIISATSRVEAAGHFIWVASDGWASSAQTMADLGKALWGAIVVSPVGARLPEFEENFLRLTPDTTRNPWFLNFWEGFFGCSVTKGTCSSKQTLEQRKSEIVYEDVVGTLADTVNILASAMARVLRSSACEGRLGQQARACLTGSKLLSELKATAHSGYTGWLQLDVNSDRLGSYAVRQVLPRNDNETEGLLKAVLVAEFDTRTGQLTVVGNFSWKYLAQQEGEDGEKSGDWTSSVLPESRCSRPCRGAEARILQEVTCCWLCRPCRLNEYLVLNGTMCQTCPTFTWPDPDTGYTTCYNIPPDIPTFSSLRGVIQTLAGLVCFIACIAVLVYFARHWHRRIIKASSRELSLLMLLAIGLGYVTMVTLLAAPSEVTCRINYVLFCLSFSCIYSPLLVRANRIFRIFRAGQRSARRPRMTGSSHQLLFTAGLVLLQVLICCVIMSEYGPWHKRFMTVAMEAYVEVSCELPAAGLTSFLVYNLLQVAVCSLLAFKTRRLPDNFNESRFTSMCVSTTLVIWLAFIPAYLVSGREHLRLLILALALALNHSVALVFLFLPKVYAVLYLQDAADTTATTVSESRMRSQNILPNSIGVSTVMTFKPA